MFITKFADHSFFLSSEFGFDGFRIKIIKIFDQDFGSKLSKISDEQIKELQNQKDELRKIINEQELKIAKIDKKLNKIKSFKQI